MEVLEDASPMKGLKRWRQNKPEHRLLRESLSSECEWNFSAVIKLDVDMRVRVSGMKGIASFRLGAKFGTSGMPTPLILHHVDRNVAALREAFYETAERQRTL